MRDNVAVVPQILTLPFMALPEPQPALKDKFDGRHEKL